MTLPYSASSALFAGFSPVTEMTRALDVLYALPIYRPEERVTAVQILDEFSQTHFGPEAPETQSLEALAQNVMRTRGEILDPSQLESLFTQWRRHERPQSGTQRIPKTLTPLFDAGPVRFFQSTNVSAPLRPHQILGESNVGGGYLASNEPSFGNYYSSIEGLGGVVLGVGGFQTLNLAAASSASGLIFADISPTVAYTLALLLPLMAQQPGPAEFVNEVSRLFDETSDPSPYVEPIPQEFRPALQAHVERLRHASVGKNKLLRFLNRSLLDPSHVLGSASAYAFVSGLIAQGDATIIHGNLFGDDMPDLVTSALVHYEDPLRTVYVSNAPEEVAQKHCDHSLASFLEILEGSQTDRAGRFLITTEFSPNRAIKIQRQKTGDAFSYHGRKIAAAAALLRGYGRLSPFVDRFELRTRTQRRSTNRMSSITPKRSLSGRTR